MASSDQPGPNDLLTVNEVATRLRRTPSALRFMIHADTAPRSALIVGRRMFRRADVDRWIEERFEEAAS